MRQRSRDQRGLPFMQCGKGLGGQGTRLQVQILERLWQVLVQLLLLRRPATCRGQVVGFHATGIGRGEGKGRGGRGRAC